MQAAMMPDGVRLHLHDGPIDLIVYAETERKAAYDAACRRFEGLLLELTGELAELRREGGQPQSPVGRRMAAATAPHAPQFITPMAAVAGSVAEEILAVMGAAVPEGKQWVNNGGDIAWRPGDEPFRLAMPGGTIEVPAEMPFRGCATSGRGGRSHSLGIADTVTVLASGAAQADAAATMIANMVDLPGHPAVERQPACELSPDSDLGSRLVTTGLGEISVEEALEALERGATHAEMLLARGLIGAAQLWLAGQGRMVAPQAPDPALAAGGQPRAGSPGKGPVAG
ncbi:hypothetical protein SAMN06297129_3409 [Pseudooceanicola antarcticus]|uniref:FAD:protein FMN transferase n=1 Tax=Pseudooceanicola antarcticus TaxID=1247613 RepID=A0A285JBE4_9RHOB|nr:hypothetical protein [Pseudooceanicola antarcticus]PJE30879.1 hypothetical protein CVM39_05390 [Pseudooceanicola antarcticus]SNY57589.1 hypothetical protein SAMN06297129_3409 [Pseudooceanicola antarcticus]